MTSQLSTEHREKRIGERGRLGYFPRAHARQYSHEAVKKEIDSSKDAEEKYPICRLVGDPVAFESVSIMICMAIPVLPNGFRSEP